ncbi:nitrate- and nitrite sensing domain-containing protein [Streptomyces sp. 549]|uniref:sensor histidine kinase n=1 Tax=Streptomyces sp. 549 TaxID=3049076 RepID=UPI0024C31431|nr:nitrate- and nitrite sensing domain-containing protein [Streptomyces sp. 549]MDK1474775.1 nitrate- and nitrite sensing domain-containing protein [Streptomyces sp. 549]
MRFRGSSIRRKIVALLLVPLVAVTALWAFATYLTGREAGQLLRLGDIVEQIVHPAEETVQAVQQERRQILVHLADPRRSDALTELRRQQRATDRAVERISDNALHVRGNLPADSRQKLDALLERLDGLDSVRTKVENNTLSRDNAFAAYNAVVDPAYDLLTTLHVIEDVQLDKESRALVGVARARELVAREDALVAAALAAGRMSRQEVRELSDRVAERNVIYRTHLPVLPDEDRRAVEEFWQGADGRTLTAFEDDIIAAGAAGAVKAVNSARWDAATTTVLDDLKELDREAGDRYADRITPAATTVLLQAGVACVLGFLAVLLSIVVSFRVGRGLVRDLGALRKEAHEVSGVRLPSVMRRLAAGEEVDVETEAPRLEYSQDEIGQVGQALNTLQRAAMEATVKQADMRRGVSEVFVNLARRNQVLLHRQLTLLDAMERRTENSDELADLFRLDHLTTRMRRHAEGLVILSGAAPSRQWRKPVQLMDVVRAAVAEVENYERIEVRRLPCLAVEGPAVGDLTHLVAELLENATAFSPPHTAVQVLGERVPNGFALEIHDRGLGMPAEAMLEANLRLAETPEFELSDTDRLGLFVVSRLAQRQGVRVSLQQSPYGGTTAVVLVPASVLTEPAEKDNEPLDGSTSEDTGSHALEALRGAHPALTERDRTTAAGLTRAFRARGNGGPIELEAPLDDTGPGIGSLFRDLQERRSTETAAQHSHARDESRPAERADGPTPLPRRRPAGPVLVSDHGRPVGAGAEESAPRNRDTPPAEGGPRRAPTPPESQATDGDGIRPGEAPRATPPTGSTAAGGLPRRVRQASLAPQLKEQRAQGSGPGSSGKSGDGGGATDADRTGRADPAREPDATGPADGGQPDADRDADEVRRRMAALQRGWQRGREQNEGTTPEGNGR